MPFWDDIWTKVWMEWWKGREERGIKYAKSLKEERSGIVAEP